MDKTLEVLEKRQQSSPYIYRKLASRSSSVLSPRMQNVQPFQRVFLNGEWQILPLIVNQRVNRVLRRSPIAVEEKPAPIEKEKVFIPSKELTEWAIPSGSKIIPFSVATQETPSKAKIFEVETLPPISDEITKLRHKLIEREAQLSRKEEKEKILDETVESYKRQIGNLTQKNKGLEEKIKSTQEQVRAARDSASQLSEQNRQKEMESWKLKERLEKLRSSLQSSSSYIEALRKKMSEKERTLEEFRSSAQEELVRAQEIEAEKKTAETMVKNLRQALENAWKELENLKGKEGQEEELKLKEEQIRKLGMRLKEKEKQTEEAQMLARALGESRLKEKKLAEGVAAYKTQIEKLTQKKQELLSAINKEEDRFSKLKQALEKLSLENKEKETLIAEQQKKLRELASDKEKISIFASELAQKLSAAKGLKRVEEAIKVEMKRGKEEEKKRKAKFIKAKKVVSDRPLLTKLANAVNGIVTDAEGKFLESAVVIVKAYTGEALRALRTNELGQFLLTTALPNGVYHVEATYKGLDFDIIEIELTGEVLPPLEITAHRTESK